ncbi:acyl carrier protein [Actinosynnema sp. NPDC020468]|uniref:acyl carrier protein n=1 Tax=Actinosynnema sp. NPDC020468 TaxID=3154488 RepID=UPI003401C4B6
MSAETTTADLATEITTIVAAELGVTPAALTPDTDLRSIEGADSIKVLRMIAKIEQRFDVELEDEDIFGVNTVSEVVAVVEKARA